MFHGFLHLVILKVVLVTDLHGENILAAQRQSWARCSIRSLYVGDPTYDVLQHMLNCPD